MEHTAGGVDGNDAFISYNRADVGLARTLQEALERRARQLDPKLTGGRRHLRIVRDETDLTAADQLREELRRHVAQSRTLVVICSPDARRSPWVPNEIAFFREHVPDGRIVAVIAAGDDPPKVTAFPPILLEGDREPLAVEFRPSVIAAGGIDYDDYVADDGALRVLAPIVRVDYPVLKDRQGVYERQVLRRRASVTTALMLLFALVAWFAWQQRNRAIDRLAENYWTQAGVARSEGDWLKAVHLLARAASVTRDRSVVADAAFTIERLIEPLRLGARGVPSAPLRGAERDDTGRLLTWSADGSVNVWSPESASGQTLGPRIGGLSGAAWLPGHLGIVGWANDGRVLVWPWHGGQFGELSNRTHGAAVRRVVASAHGRLLSLGGPTARVWSIAEPTRSVALVHTSDVDGALLTPNGALAVTWTGPRLHFWDARTGTPLGTSEEHAGSIVGAVVDPSGTRLVAWSFFGSGSLWSIGDTTKAPVRLQELRADGAAFGSSTTALVVWTRDGAATIRDAATGRVTCAADAMPLNFQAATFDPGGHRLVLWGLPGLFYVIDVAACRTVPVSTDSPLSGARFVNAASVLTWDWTGKLQLWNVTGTAFSLAAAQHDDTLRDVLVDAERGLVVSRSSKTARAWRLDDLTPIGLPVREGGALRGVALNADATFWTWGEDGVVSLWKADTKRRDMALLQHDGAVAGMVASRDRRHVAAWTADTVSIWTFVGDAIQVRRLAPFRDVSGARFAEQGDALVAWNGRGEVRSWPLDRDTPDPAIQEDDLSGLALSPDGSTIATWPLDGSAHLWNRRTGNMLGPALVHGGPIHRVVFSRSGRLVATCSVDGTARVWDAGTGQAVTPPLVQPKRTASLDTAVIVRAQLRVLSSIPPPGPVDVLFMSDDTRLVTWDRHGTAAIWDVFTGKMVGVPISHSDAVMGAASSPDGRTVLTWSKDGRVASTLVESGRPTWPPLLHDSVAGVRWGRRLSMLLTWGGDGSARLWSAVTGKAVSTVMAHDGAVSGALFDGPEDRVLTWSGDATARIWRREGTAIAALRHPVEVQGAVWSEDDRRILTWDAKSTVRVWFARDGGPAAPLPERSSEGGDALYLPPDRVLMRDGGFSLRLQRLGAATREDALLDRVQAATGLVLDDVRGFVATRPARETTSHR